MTAIEEGKTGPRWVAGAAWTACAATVLLYLGLKQFSYGYVPGDENIYYYMAKVMAEGKAWPYRDFFFAHPPVQLFVAASAFKLCGASYEVARSLPILSGLAAGLAVFAIGYRRLGAVEGAVAQAAFLLAHDTLRNTSHYTGANLGVALLLWGVYFLLRGRDILGGVLLALSAQTVVYAVPAVIMVLVWRFLEAPRPALRAIAAAFGLYVAISLACLILGGGGYTEAVFKFHLMKKARDQDKAKILSRVFRLHNFYLAWAPVVAAAALIWWRRESPVPAAGGQVGPEGGAGEPHIGGGVRTDHKRRRKTIRQRTGGGRRPRRGLSALPASPQGLVVGLIAYLACYGLFLWRLREWFDFYFLVLFPALALLVGYLIGEILIGIRSLVGGSSPWPAVRSLVLAAVVVFGYAVVKRSQRQQYPRAEDKSYAWVDAPHLGFLNPWFKKVFWRERREIDRDYLGPTYYLWHESRHLNEVRSAVDYLREHSKPEDRLFGESGLAPLVAFLADRDLAGYVADTNTKRISSKQTTIRAMLARIDLPELRYVIASKRGGRFLFINGHLADWLEANFAEVYRFGSRTRPGITWLVLERKGAGVPADPSGTAHKRAT